MIIMQTIKIIYIGGPCKTCGKTTHKEKIDQSQNHF